MVHRCRHAGGQSAVRPPPPPTFTPHGFAEQRSSIEIEVRFRSAGRQGTPRHGHHSDFAVAPFGSCLASTLELCRWLMLVSTGSGDEAIAGGSGTCQERGGQADLSLHLGKSHRQKYCSTYAFFEGKGEGDNSGAMGSHGTWGSLRCRSSKILHPTLAA